MAVGAKIAKTADRKKVMDTSKSTDCPKCGKAIIAINPNRKPDRKMVRQHFINWARF